MKFLDLNGLKHLLTKIKANFGITIVNVSDYRTKLDNTGNINIPFVAKHQIVNMDLTNSINVCDWFQKALKGSILEIVLAGARGCGIYCTQNSISFMYQMRISQHGPILTNIGNLDMSYNYYARLIKIDNNTLVVATFVQNN